MLLTYCNNTAPTSLGPPSPADAWAAAMDTGIPYMGMCTGGQYDNNQYMKVHK